MDHRRPMDQDQLMARSHHPDTRATRTGKPSQLRRRRMSKLGISAQRGSQNDALTVKGKKKATTDSETATVPWSKSGCWHVIAQRSSF